jgi:hypothetical protein
LVIHNDLRASKGILRARGLIDSSPPAGIPPTQGLVKLKVTEVIIGSKARDNARTPSHADTLLRLEVNYLVQLAATTQANS